MKKLILVLSTMCLTLSANAQSQLALNGRIVSMPSSVKVSVSRNELGSQTSEGSTNGGTDYKLSYKIQQDFIHSGMVFQDRRIVWLTYGGAQSGPKYLGQLREDFQFVVQTPAGLRKTVIIRAASDSRQFVAVFGSTKNGRGPIDGISIQTSDSSLVEIN